MDNETPKEPLPPGKRLAQLRREKGLSIEDVCEATRISANNIRAIEAQEYDRLPAATFVRGLVTLYGNFLGLDGPAVAAEFQAARDQAQSGGRRRVRKRQRPAHLMPKKLAEPAHVSSATVALLLLIAIVLSFTGFCLYTSWNPFGFLLDKIASRTASLTTMVAPPVDQSPPAEQMIVSPETQPAETDLGYTVRARFRKKTTVTVIVDDQAPQQFSVKAGEDRSWTANHSLKMVFADADAAILEYNGSRLRFPEPEGSALPTLTLPDDLLDQ